MINTELMSFRITTHHVTLGGTGLNQYMKYVYIMITKISPKVISSLLSQITLNTENMIMRWMKTKFLT